MHKAQGLSFSFFFLVWMDMDDHTDVCSSVFYEGDQARRKRRDARLVDRGKLSCLSSVGTRFSVAKDAWPSMSEQCFATAAVDYCGIL